MYLVVELGRRAVADPESGTGAPRPQGTVVEAGMAALLASAVGVEAATTRQEQN